MLEFQKFNKIPRLSREIIITEKIDGTNGQIYIVRYKDFWNKCTDGYAFYSIQDFIDQYCLYKTVAIESEDDILYMFAGSRNKWLDCSSKGDNFGFAKWVKENAEELLKLGEGRHYGEWWGKGIQRGYGLDEKRFSLFNVNKWADKKTGIELKDEDKRNYCPECCYVVPTLWIGEFDTLAIESNLKELKRNGSIASPNFMNPEGIIIYHTASRTLFKKTIENDEKGKG